MYPWSQLWVTMVFVEALNPKLDKYLMFKNIFLLCKMNSSKNRNKKLAKLINAFINCRASRLLLCVVYVVFVYLLCKVCSRSLSHRECSHALVQHMHTSVFCVRMDGVMHASQTQRHKVSSKSCSSCRLSNSCLLCDWLCARGEYARRKALITCGFEWIRKMYFCIHYISDQHLFCLCPWFTNWIHLSLCT